ncbi:hypothetical protein ACFYPN_24050 [Streptomyces sp. NPDC005576]
MVNCAGKQVTAGTTFAPSTYDAYTLDAAKDVPALLREYAGPQSTIGG